MNVQELNIVELENRYEMTVAAEVQCVDPVTHVVDMATKA